MPNKDLYSNLAAIPDDREEIMAELEELLEVTPETSNRGRMDHLLAKLSTLGGGGLPRATAADNFLNVYPNTSQADMYHCVGILPPLTAEVLASYGGFGSVVGIGTDDNGIVQRLSIVGGQLYRESSYDYNGPSAMMATSSVAVADGSVPFIARPVADRARGNNQANGAIKIDEDEGTVDIRFYDSYGTISSATETTLLAHTLDLSGARDVNFVPFNVTAKWNCMLLWSAIRNQFEIGYTASTGAPNKGWLDSPQGINAKFFTVHHTSDNDLVVGAALVLHGLGTTSHTIIAENSDGTGVEANAMSSGMTSDFDADYGEVLMKDATTAYTMLVNTESYMSEASTSKTITLGEVTLSTGAHVGKHYTRMELDPKGIYGVPFLYDLSTASLKLLAMPRLDGSGVDMFELSGNGDVDLTGVKFIFPLPAEIRSAYLSNRDTLLTAHQAPAGWGITVLGARSTSVSGQRKIIASQPVYSNSFIDKLYQPDFTVGVYASLPTKESYISTIDVYDGVKLDTLNFAFLSPSYVGVVSNFNGAAMVDHRPVFLRSDAPEGTQVLLARNKIPTYQGSSYRNGITRSVSTPILQVTEGNSDPVDLGVVLGYIGMTNDHPRYSGAAVCTMTAEGWEVVNLT